MRSNMNIEQRLANSAEALDSAVDSYQRDGRTPSVDQGDHLVARAHAHHQSVDVAEQTRAVGR